MLLAEYRLSQCAFNRPSASDAVVDRRLTEANKFCPFRYAVAFAIHDQQMVVALVAALLLHCRPAAVARLIVAVGIGVAVNGVASGACPHVSQEGLERVSPSVAYNNSAATIAHKERRIFVVTPLFHGMPDMVGTRLLADARMTMTSISGDSGFSRVTTTRKSMPITQRASIYGPFSGSGTRTSASPERFALMIQVRKVHNGPSAKHTTSQVDHLARHCYRSCNERIAGLQSAGRIAAIAIFGSYPSPAPKHYSRQARAIQDRIDRLPVAICVKILEGSEFYGEPASGI